MASKPSCSKGMALSHLIILLLFFIIFFFSNSTLSSLESSSFLFQKKLVRVRIGESVVLSLPLPYLPPSHSASVMPLPVTSIPIVPEWAKDRLLYSYHTQYGTGKLYSKLKPNPYITRVPIPRPNNAVVFGLKKLPWQLSH